MKKKGTFETVLTFVVSPFLSLPFMFMQLKRGNDKYIVLLLSILLGFLSYLYIPNVTNDKVEYFSRYELFQDYNYKDLWLYLAQVYRPDFLFDHLIFLFAKLNVNISYFFFTITFVTIFSLLTFIKTILTQQQRSYYTYSVFSLLLIFSIISLNGLFSNIRFLLTASIFIWSLYYFFFNRKLFRAIVLLVTTLLFHFSFTIFIPGIFLVLLLPNIYRYLRAILGISMVFLLVPNGLDIIGNLTDSIGLPNNYLIKVDTYVNSEMEVSRNALILFYLRNLWLYLACFYFLFKEKFNNDVLVTLLVVFLSFINLTHSNPFVFSRYSIVFSVLFVIFLIYRYKQKSLNHNWLIVFSVFFILHLFIDILVLRNNLSASYSIKDLFSIYSILIKQITPNDFLGE
ncbi:MAG TPA: EpsG family protein [Flavobacterium sp.]|nr:EpsG family protein [Flavobacterium sp.]